MNDGALAGSYTVSVDPFFKDGARTAQPVSPVPPKFTSPETSDVTVEVEEKDNELKIQLK